MSESLHSKKRKSAAVSIDSEEEELLNLVKAKKLKDAKPKPKPRSKDPKPIDPDLVDRPEFVIPPELNVSSNKSKVRHMLEQKFPSAFSASPLHGNKVTSRDLEDLKDKLESSSAKDGPKSDGNTQLYIEDVLQAIKSYRITKDETKQEDENAEQQQDEESTSSDQPKKFKFVMTGSMFAERLLRNAYFFMNKNSSNSTHILQFDKYLFVPITKGSEQHKRDQFKNKEKADDNNNESTEVKKSWVGDYLNFSEPIPDDWNEALEDREGRLGAIIKFLTKCWINPSSGKACLDPLIGKRCIIDGHNLSKQELIDLGVEGIERAEKLLEQRTGGNVDFRLVPICIERPSLNDKPWNIFPSKNNNSRIPNKRAVYVVPELYNKLGESDFSAFFFIRKLSELAKTNLKTKIFTVDTDLQIFTLAHLLRWFYLIQDAKSYHLEQKIDRIKRLDMSDRKSFNAYKNSPQEYSYLQCIAIQYEPRQSWQFYTTDLNMKLVKSIDMKRLFIDVSESNLFRVNSDQKDQLIIKTKEAIYHERKSMTKHDIQSSKDEQVDDNDTVIDIDEDEGNLEYVSTVTRSENDRIKRNYMFKNKIIPIILLWLIGGCDYNESYRFITHNALWEAMTKWSTYIGDVITFDENNVDSFDCGVTINPDAYVRLIKCAYIIAKCPKYKEYDPELVTIEMISVDRKLKAKNSKSSTPPPLCPLEKPELIKKTYGHALYIIKMLFQVGNDELVINGKPGDYGYAKINHDKPWTKSNTRRVYC